jgi:D-alanine-D-alanine ligase
VSVLILHDALAPDARPDELDVLDQARAVAGALAERGVPHALASFPADVAAAAAAIRRAAPSVVFNLVESVARECRLAPLAAALFDGLGLPYTGAGTRGLALTASKLATRRALARAELPVPAAHTLAELEAGALVAPGRYVLKAVWEHGSVGLEADSVLAAGDAAELAAALRSRLPAIGGEGYAEAYVGGREFNVALLDGEAGPECLPIAEIRFTEPDPERPRIVGYRAKWSPGSAEDAATPRSFAAAEADRPLREELRRLAVGVWRACDLAGYARVDIRVDGRGRAAIIDVNPNPCLTPGAGFAATLEQAGIPFADAVQRLLATALRRAHGR